jgi:hypothetical protein
MKKQFIYYLVINYIHQAEIIFYWRQVTAKHRTKFQLTLHLSLLSRVLWFSEESQENH